MLPWLLIRIAPLLMAVLFAVAPLVSVTAADNGTHFKSMNVSVWPEYDEPSIFVNYAGEIAGDVTLPATVRFSVPSGYQIGSTCEIDANGQHTVVPYKEEAGEAPAVSYSSGQKDTHMEFYYNPVDGVGHREFTYKFVTPGAVDSLVLDIQQPLRSSNFVASPASKQVLSDKEGFKYHRYEYTNLAAGQTLSFTFSYDKADGKPSVERQQAANTATTGGTVGGGEYALPLILIGLGMVSLAGFFFLRTRERPRRRVALATAAGSGRQKAYVRTPSGAPAGPTGSGRHTAYVRTEPGATGRAARPLAAEEARFCTRCGAQLRAGAAFCSACGTPVKRKA